MRPVFDKSSKFQGPSWLWSHGSWIYNYLCNQCLSPLMLWVWILLRARCATLCDKDCQWLAAGQWFSPGTPVSSTKKTVRHDITKILLKVVLNTIKPTKISCQRRVSFPAYLQLLPILLSGISKIPHTPSVWDYLLLVPILFEYIFLLVDYPTLTI
jgi:hypothetical protein